MQKLKWFLGFALLATLIWYFFLKEEHYIVRFSTAQPPGVVFRHIEEWPEFGNSDSLKIQWESGDRYTAINQKIIDGNDTLDYRWEFKRVSDSLTRVKAKITDYHHYWKRKFEAPLHFGNFVSENVARVKNVGEELLKKEATFRVHTMNDTLFPATFCAYRQVSNVPVIEKARRMLTEIQGVMKYIKTNEIPMIGDPFLEITHWDQEKNTIGFNFCFPIQKMDSLPPTSEVLFKTTKPREFLKTEFNGNYMVSDQAWYYLMDHAEQNDIDIELLPVEVYRNDPHQGENILDWVAHILVPLK